MFQNFQKKNPLSTTVGDLRPTVITWRYLKASVQSSKRKFLKIRNRQKKKENELFQIFALFNLGTPSKCRGNNVTYAHITRMQKNRSKYVKETFFTLFITIQHT